MLKIAYIGGTKLWTNMTLPTIHINGTSPEMLVEGYLEARRAVEAAKDAINKIEFNARDYYTQGGRAWDEAVKEHRARLNALQQVSEELLELAAHCQDAADERERRRNHTGANNSVS